ncbi:MAG: squalene synthase HpnC [Chloroflexota bacterium]|nr:squalene synthase HpnC [Chloroflexota bacterium]
MANRLTFTPDAWTHKAAFDYCQRLARSHYENFTVGSWLIPRDKLRHMYAIYAYCRTVDDLGDEATTRNLEGPPSGRTGPTGPAEPAQPDAVARLAAFLPEMGGEKGQDERSYRLSLLALWQSELEACYSSKPVHPVMVALQETIEEFELPPEPFLKLIEANRMDQHNHRYPTYRDLLHYCEHSANPVGRLVLGLFGYRDEGRGSLSDATCTALQLTNFWQDVARDYRKGRIYIPLEDMERFGYTERELDRGTATPAFRQLMAFEVDRAMDLFRVGAPLASTLEGTVRLDVALFTRGGMAVLEAIEKQSYDVLTERPRLSRARKAGLFLSTWASWKLGLGLGLPGPR